MQRIAAPWVEGKKEFAGEGGGVEADEKGRVMFFVGKRQEPWLGGEGNAENFGPEKLPRQRASALIGRAQPYAVKRRGDRQRAHVKSVGSSSSPEPGGTV